MDRMKKKIPFRVSLWEQILIYRLRQIHKKHPNEFFVSVHYTKNLVILHVAQQSESFRINSNGNHLTENS